MLFILDVNSAQPSDFGNFYELYAIAAAVLGGCSLKGGESSITGVILGATLMQVLRNAIVLLDIPTQLEFAIIGGVILAGASAEEIVRRAAQSRSRAQA
jgi:ribose transport system permease protein